MNFDAPDFLPPLLWRTSLFGVGDVDVEAIFVFETLLGRL
jgi:hypothetical protein